MRKVEKQVKSKVALTTINNNYFAFSFFSFFSLFSQQFQESGY